MPLSDRVKIYYHTKQAMEIRETIKEIKTQLRLSMNGITSAHQRKQGLDYKINFGVEIPRLKELASNYPKDKQLAEVLWAENIRESKLLAIFLYPTDKFTAETAEKWIDESPFTEIADHRFRNLLVSLGDAKEKALMLISDKSNMRRYCGYSTLSNLFRAGATLDPKEESLYLEALKKTLDQTEGSHLPTCNAAIISLTRYTEKNRERAASICDKIEKWEINNNEAIKSLIQNIREEY